jgi:hypothetical protein
MKKRIDIEANIGRNFDLMEELHIETDGRTKEDVEAEIQETVDQMGCGEHVHSQWSWVTEPEWEEVQK